MIGLIHEPALMAAHDKVGHAEHAGRLALAALDSLSLENFAPNVELRGATDAELLAVHTPSHLQAVAVKCASGGGMLDPDTYCGPESEAIARAVAGGLIDLSCGVLSGTFTNGLAIVRPPGHHATSNQAMGFCLYNTVAVAAAALRNRGVPRVAIIDFDVHHGNGTQDIFYADNSVLYLSSHQYPHYPGSGAASETGTGAGEGFTLNHPLDAGTGDAEFLAAYTENLLPALASFQPGFILVSAGYDAHVSDPLAGLNVTTAGFRKLSALLVQAATELCGGKIVFSLEGGYHPGALAEGLTETAQVLAKSR